MNKKKFKCALLFLSTSLIVSLFSGNVSIADTESSNMWQYISQDEQNLGLVSYDLVTGTLTFGLTDTWSGRMMYNGITDLSGKNYAVEFDANLAGGALGIYPNYEDSTHFSGVALDFGGAAIDGITVNETVQDDFSFREMINGTTIHPVVSVPAYASTNNRIRVEFKNGSNGTLAGGTAVVYTKATGAVDFTLLGSYSFSSDLLDNAGMPNRLVIQLWLGSGSISNITVDEITSPVEPLPDKWEHINEAEEQTGLAAYNKSTDTLTFGLTDTWSGRMMYNGITDLSGKNYAVEFDANLAGGALGIYPNYEDSTHFSGVALDFGGAAIDGITVNETVQDDFSFREMINGTTIHPVVSVPAYAATNNRIRVEFKNGSNGTLAGGTAVVYTKATGAVDFTLLGSYSFSSDLSDNAGMPNRLVIQLWLGSGSISNITVDEITSPVEPLPDKWEHINRAEENVGDAMYSSENDTISFDGCSGWSSRLINTEINDISNKNFAVEFDANLGKSGAIGISPFYETVTNFYSVYYDIAGMRLDGVGINGMNDNTLNVIDDFAYINDSLYPYYPIRECSDTYANDIRIRAEFFLGENGTMATGKARYYYKKTGDTTWHCIGEFIMPDSIIDSPDNANKIVIHGRLLTGTINNITISEISKPIVEDTFATSKEWGYISDIEKSIGSAQYNDTTGNMILNANYWNLWDTRMISLTVPDVSEKCFSLEFNADLNPGGAIGVIPFYEDSSNWYGVYFDRGALLIDGVGYNNKECIDDFAYINNSLYQSIGVSSYPVLGSFCYRFEYFCNPNGGASGGSCRLYYKVNLSGNLNSDLWRLIGEFKIPEKVIDRPDIKNRIMIHARLLTGTISNIKYAEISRDYKTKYLEDDSGDIIYEDGFPEDNYTPAEKNDFDNLNLSDPKQDTNTSSNDKYNSSNNASESTDQSNNDSSDPMNQQSGQTKKAITKQQKITEFGKAPLWSVIMIIIGGIILAGVLLIFITQKKIRKTGELKNI